jgi:hypothetical protein
VMASLHLDSSQVFIPLLPSARRSDADSLGATR